MRDLFSPQAGPSGGPVHEDAGEILHGGAYLHHPLARVGQRRSGGLTLDPGLGQAVPGAVKNSLLQALQALNRFSGPGHGHLAGTGQDGMLP